MNNLYTVSALNNEAGALLTTHFNTVFVTGEISNLSRPSSGHLYFSLKDTHAQIRCALFRFQHQQIDFTLQNGQAVIVQAQVSLYEPRGDFQLIVSHVQLAGVGQLQMAFEQLKTTLAQLGWFDEQRKKPLPPFPKKIGIITSTSAAALQDILKVLKRRAPHIPIVIYTTSVQGGAATTQIVSAIKKANQHAVCDVLILARGGGSIEDLWCFNERNVAQAIVESVIPIITGIGHQTDFTIADFVADVRAPTPSAAAECVSPNRDEYSTLLTQLLSRMQKTILSQLAFRQHHLQQLEKRLQHPGEKIKQQAQQIDQAEMRLTRAMQLKITGAREKIGHIAQLLDTLSPLSTLNRGFSITRSKQTQKIVLRANTLKKGDRILTRLAEGEVESQVV